MSAASVGPSALLPLSPAPLSPGRMWTTAQSRHVATASSDEGEQRIRTKPPPWRLVGALLAIGAALLLLRLGGTALVLLLAAARLGPLNHALCLLPEVHSVADFENRRYRVQQSMWLVSICCALYTLIPEEQQMAAKQGWKMNLVTMETSMASGIAATYGYSVAGGVPGGLLAEYVMSSLGKQTVVELTPFVGGLVARAGVSFALFMVMGAFMEFLAQTAYAFAHQRERTGEQSDELSDERSTIQARHAEPEDKPHRE